MIDAFSMFPRNVLPNACTSIKSVKYKTGYFADILSDKHDIIQNWNHYENLLQQK